MTVSDRPVAGARVTSPDGPLEALTDDEGRFLLKGAEPPLRLVFHHSFFVTRTVTLSAETPLPLLVVLETRPGLLQRVEVSARRGGDPGAPVGVVSTVVKPGDGADSPSTLSEMIVQVPGVSENGQGGLLQTVSIRGISRHRVQSQVAGMRLTTERRAGASVSFLDPLLIEAADVLRGPASSYYGSGALGGVIQVFPRRFTAPLVALGYNTQGDGNVLAAGYGTGRWSVGAARREAANAEAADGTELNSGFTQTSANLQGVWGDGPRRTSLIAVFGHGTDIGKASSDFPARTTVYPRERHHLLSFSTESERGWMFRAAVHPHDLETDVVEAGVGRSNVKSNALDLAVRWDRELGGAASITSRLGVELFSRRDVDTDEVRVSFDPNDPMPVQRFASLDNANETEAGLFGTLRGTAHGATWEAGARLIWINQENAAARSRDQTTASGFTGISVPLTGHLNLEAHVGTGLRFPSLGERFFTGTTGRGQISGNPDLDAERSFDVDLGLRRVTERLLLSGAVFRNRIQDYIERVEVAPDQFTFVNLTDGEITGAELQGAWRPSPTWRIGFGGHLLDGEGDGGRPLADIPPDEIFAALSRERDQWTVTTRWSYRGALSDPGSGEQAIPGAHRISASLALHPSPAWRIDHFGTNLLDEQYFRSADRKAAPAPGRTIGVSLTWTPR